jgi:hypothetical protein
MGIIPERHGAQIHMVEKEAHQAQPHNRPLQCSEPPQSHHRRLLEDMGTRRTGRGQARRNQGRRDRQPQQPHRHEEWNQCKSSRPPGHHPQFSTHGTSDGIRLTIGPVQCGQEGHAQVGLQHKIHPTQDRVGQDSAPKVTAEHHGDGPERPGNRFGKLRGKGVVQKGPAEQKDGQTGKEHRASARRPIRRPQVGQQGQCRTRRHRQRTESPPRKPEQQPDKVGHPVEPVHPGIKTAGPANNPPGPARMDYIILSSVSAISLGVAATPMPAARKASNLAWAVPLPPLTMAPA